MRLSPHEAARRLLEMRQKKAPVVQRPLLGVRSIDEIRAGLATQSARRPPIIGVTPPEVLQEKRQTVRAKREATEKRAAAKKPPAIVQCPCGVGFEVSPPSAAKVTKYHSPECRQKYRVFSTRKYGKFTAEMDAQIIAAYQYEVGMKKVQKGQGIVKALAEELGLPRWKISRRAFDLGVVKQATYPKERTWTEAELELLKQNAALSVNRIQSKFRAAGYSRTRHSVVNKVKRLFGRKPREGYSGTALAALFGIDAHSITRLIEAGFLKATRRGTERSSRQGGDAWHMDDQAVREFVVENVAIIDFRKIDKFWLVELLTGKEVSF